MFLSGVYSDDDILFAARILYKAAGRNLDFFSNFFILHYKQLSTHVANRKQLWPGIPREICNAPAAQRVHTPSNTHG